MKIAPLKTTDPWFARIVNDERVSTDALVGVPIESTVEMELVELLHEGPEGNYRPYLHLRGELTEARPVVQLPYGVDELALRRGGGVTIDAFYDFNQKQLGDLVKKGYFSEAFKVPEGMAGIPWTLPGKADFLVVAPELSDEPPVVFMSVHDQTSLGLDEANSGYELAEYFSNFSNFSAEAQAEAVAPEPTAEIERSAEVQDVFSDVVFEEHRPTTEAGVRRVVEELDDRGYVPDSVFSRLIAEIESQRPAEPESVIDDEPEEEPVAPGSAWEVYLARVQPGVEQVLSAEYVPDDLEDQAEGDELEQDVEPVVPVEEPEQEAPVVTVTPEGFLDLADDEPEVELTPISVQLAEPTDEDHRRVADRRAARVRAELEGADDAATTDETQPGL